MEEYKEVKNVSYGSNIKNAFGGMLVGLVLFIASFFVLWVNEGNSVKQINKADFMSKTAIAVTADSIDRANDNKLISLSSKATTEETLADDEVKMKNALVLNRKVEMYQWIENEQTQTVKNSKGSTTETTTYTYTKEWKDHEVNSQHFHKPGYENPKFNIESKRYNAASGQLGAYKLTSLQTSHINNLAPYASLSESKKYKLIDGFYYSGENYIEPKVGDIRISYSYAPSGVDISIIGEQRSDNTISEMPNKNGNIYLQYDGIYTQDEMIEKFKNQNKVLTWLFRFLGWLIMFIGLSLITKPLSVIASFVPVLSNIVDFISSSILFIISLALSLLVIAVAWFAYRPFLTIILVACAVFAICFAKKRRA